MGIAAHIHRLVSRTGVKVKVLPVPNVYTIHQIIG